MTLTLALCLADIGLAFAAGLLLGAIPWMWLAFRWRKSSAVWQQLTAQWREECESTDKQLQQALALLSEVTPHQPHIQ